MCNNFLTSVCLWWEAHAYIIMHILYFVILRWETVVNYDKNQRKTQTLYYVYKSDWQMFPDGT